MLYLKIMRRGRDAGEAGLLQCPIRSNADGTPTVLADFWRIGHAYGRYIASKNDKWEPRAGQCARMRNELILNLPDGVDLEKLP